MFRKFLFLAAVATLSLAGLAAPARAAFEVKFAYGAASILVDWDGTNLTTTTAGGASTAGATITHTVSGGFDKINVMGLVVSPTATTGGFAIDASIAKSNSPGTQFIASISLSGLDILNQTGVAGNSLLTITTGDIGFTKPSGATVGMVSTVSATATGTNSADAKIVFNSYLDTTNTQFGTQQGTPTITLDPLHPGSSLAGNTVAILTGLPTPYSITQVEQITLANGDSLTDGSSGTTVSVPVPAGVVLALTALPGLGLFIRRRRAATVVA